jgi:hypothetical protein
MLRDMVPRNLPFERESMDAIRHALEGLRTHWLPAHLRSEFCLEFNQLLGYFLSQVDLTRGADKARLDSGYTVLSELGLQVYKPYAVQMSIDAKERLNSKGIGFYETVLVAKFLDQVDNLRTSEVANLSSIEKMLIKAEIVLDNSFFLHRYIQSTNIEDTTFIPLYDYLKFNLIEQLSARQKALGHLADTRFGYLTEYLKNEIRRAQDKYKVDRCSVEELRRLRTVIQEGNNRIAEKRRRGEPDQEV